MRVPEKNQKGERRYGIWAGDAEGQREDRFLCAAEIPAPPSWRHTQCSRRRGYGPGNEFCKQHAKKLGAYTETTT